MEIVTKVMEKSWKSHGNLLVKMCTNPVYYLIVFWLTWATILHTNLTYAALFNIQMASEERVG